MNRKQRLAHAMRRATSWLVPTCRLGAGEADARVAIAWCDGYDAGVRAERKKHRPARADYGTGVDGTIPAGFTRLSEE
jgi:hypothetical protein